MNNLAHKQYAEYYGGLLKSAGVPFSPKTDVLALIVLAGYVMDDAVVEERSKAFRTFHPFFKAMYDTDYEACLRSLSKEEKTALVERIAAKRGKL